MNKKVLIITISTIVVLSLGVGAVIYFSKNNKDVVQTNQSNKNQTEKPIGSSTGAPEAREVARDLAIKDIETIIISGGYTSLEEYMAPSVEVILAASEAGDKQSPKEATENLKRLESSAGGWTFILPESTIENWLKGPYGKYLPKSSSDGSVGQSIDGQIIAFTLNKSNKIDKIFMGEESLML